MGHVLVAATVIESRCDEKHGKPLVGEVVDWHRVGAKNALHALLLAETRSVLRQRVVRLTLRRAQVISERFRERWRGHTRENRRSLLEESLAQRYVSRGDASEPFARQRHDLKGVARRSTHVCWGMNCTTHAGRPRCATAAAAPPSPKRTQTLCDEPTTGVWAAWRRAQMHSVWAPGRLVYMYLCRVPMSFCFHSYTESKPKLIMFRIS
jgi:hypothetical protein